MKNKIPTTHNAPRQTRRRHRNCRHPNYHCGQTCTLGSDFAFNQEAKIKSGAISVIPNTSWNPRESFTVFPAILRNYDGSEEAGNLENS
jgi:hypothetical protein